MNDLQAVLGSFLKKQFMSVKIKCQHPIKTSKFSITNYVNWAVCFPYFLLYILPMILPDLISIAVPGVISTA